MTKGSWIAAVIRERGRQRKGSMEVETTTVDDEEEMKGMGPTCRHHFSVDEEGIFF
jgi:hypothetical protein